MKNVKRIRQIIPPCGLCGKKRKPLEKTECCNNWVCGNEGDYVLFSYSRNICTRNHRRFTLCGYHHTERHEGDWKTCNECFESFKHELEMYVWYGTNEYNFEKLEHPPKFKPTLCAKCKKVIVLSEGGFSTLCGIYRCDSCPVNESEREKIISNYNKFKNRYE